MVLSFWFVAKSLLFVCLTCVEKRFFMVKIGNIRTWTGDLSICSRMLYHWAMFPKLDITNLHLYFIYVHAVWPKKALLKYHEVSGFRRIADDLQSNPQKFTSVFALVHKNLDFSLWHRLHLTCEHELKKLHLLWMMEYMLNWIGDLSICIRMLYNQGCHTAFNCKYCP